MEQYIVDAFADKIFSGNTAAVLPCSKMPSADIMQNIALENNYSETAFVVKLSPGQYHLKWFTPGGEIDLCGHATLAAAYVVHNYIDKGITEIHFHTLSGELTVIKNGKGFTMDFPIGKTKPVPLTKEIELATEHMALEAYYDGGDIVVIISDENALLTFKPNGDLIRKLDGLGLIVTAKSKEVDFVSRCFYPKLDVLEDPVTGRAHTFLAPIWSKKLNKTVLTAKQLSRRGGILGIELKKDRVLLTGEVQLFMKGEIPFTL